MFKRAQVQQIYIWVHLGAAIQIWVIPGVVIHTQVNLGSLANPIEPKF